MAEQKKSFAYCKRCVMPNTKPGVIFDEEGICNACRSVEKKKLINWEERKKELIAFCDEVKRNNKGPYDCLVAVSGGKDSIYQVWYMKNICKMKILVVCVLAHLRTREGIENLNNMITNMGVDAITISLKPSTYAAARKKAFTDFGEPNWTEHLTVFSGVARIALAYKIPLTVWGEDISVEFGGPTANKRVATAEDLINNELIKGRQIDLFYDNNLIQKRYTFFYHHPPKDETRKHNLKSIYLGYFDNWDGHMHYLKAKEVAEFQERREGCLSGNFLPYDNIDEKICETHIWFKYLKFGFWRPTDQCCYFIWNGRMTREEAVKIVNKLNDEFPIEYFKDFLEFHDLTQEDFWKVAEKYRNKDIWEKVNGRWKLKYPLK